MSRKRTTTLPITKLKIDIKPSCVGCGVSVSPGLCRTGSVAIGIGFTTVTSGHQLMSLNPTTYAEIRKNIAYVERKKGYLCSGCASNYHTYQDHKGVSHPLVMTDPTPGFIGQTVAGHGIRADGMGSVD